MIKADIYVPHCHTWMDLALVQGVLSNCSLSVACLCKGILRKSATTMLSIMFKGKQDSVNRGPEDAEVGRWGERGQDAPDR